MAQNKCQMVSLPSRIMKQNFQTHEATGDGRVVNCLPWAVGNLQASAYLNFYILASFKDTDICHTSKSGCGEASAHCRGQEEGAQSPNSSSKAGNTGRLSEEVSRTHVVLCRGPTGIFSIGLTIGILKYCLWNVLRRKLPCIRPLRRSTLCLTVSFPPQEHSREAY